MSTDLGDGADTLDASAATTALVVNGGAGDDTLTTGSADDTVIGGSGDDVLDGNAGNDSLAGGAGSDIYMASAGQDTVDDAEGLADRLSFANFNHGVTFDLDAAARRSTAFDQAGNALRLVHPIRRIIGSPFSDTLLGDNADNLIAGAGGDDTIDGRSGDDILVGGAVITDGQGLFQPTYPSGVPDGKDTVTGGPGSDKLHGDGADSLTNDGVDVLFGEDGNSKT